jgi:hypothetical protein
VENITLADPLTIMHTKNSSAYKCKIAKDISSLGYCSSKETYYYGLKLHLFTTFRNKKLAMLNLIKVTQEIILDLISIKEEILL